MITNDNNVTVDDKNKIAEKFKNEFKKVFGQDLDVDNGTVINGLIEIFSQNNLEIQQLGLALYNAIFLLKSSGSVLDDHGADINIFRKPANNAFVELTIFGYVDENEPTYISVDDGEFSTADGHIFQILDDVTIDKVSYDSNNNPILDEDGNNLGMVKVQATSIETGADNNILPGSIVNAEQAIDGFYKVTNENGATGGSDVESDESLKYRIYNNRLFKPNNNKQGLENALKNLNSVVDVKIINNTSMNTDQYGNPAKSIHVYVVGGNANDIAQTIQDNILTTQTVGNEVGIATDVSGKKYNINYDTAKVVPIYLNIDAETIPDEFNSDTGVEQIKQNIIKVFTNYTMGATVDFTRLIVPCYSVDGIKTVSLALGISKDNMQLNTNIKLNDFELPQINEDLINVNVRSGK